MVRELRPLDPRCSEQERRHHVQAEVDEGLLLPQEAIPLATRHMRTNQEECFDIAGTRAAIHAELKVKS